MQVRNEDRRWFLRTLALALGAPIALPHRLQEGVFPQALAREALRHADVLESKRLLTLLSDRPLNAETPVHLLDDDITPNHLHFVRNNGHIPERALSGRLGDWSLAIDGEVEHPRQWTLAEIRDRFPHREALITLECAGNGRAGYHPGVSGNQWTLGAVGCARYRGVRLRDLLDACKVRSSATYIGWYGEDPHLSRNPQRRAISRGVPIAKALDPHTLLAWEMNGRPLPPAHGWPLRLLAPGWPGSASGKWLRRIWVRDRTHDGEKMTGSSYRMPRHPVEPGEAVPAEEMEIIGMMPVKSVITRPRSGTRTDRSVTLRGKAWSGTGWVDRVELSFDFGATWRPTRLRPAPNRYAWQVWQAELQLPTRGYYEIWARATDDQGRSQPMIVPGWNPKGYLNNAMHRIALRVP